MAKTWEDNIALSNADDYNPTHIGPITDYLSQDDGQVAWRRFETRAIAELAVRDQAPLPATADREGYYGGNHFNYWASGFVDAKLMAAWLQENGVSLQTYLDIGCASGRVIRHFASQFDGIDVYGCDINRRHVDWCNRFLPHTVTVFQNTSLPHIQLPDESVDLVSAFSVFTHVEAFDTAWLMEIRRVLRKGGVAWITIHGDRTWREVSPTWPLHTPLTTHPDYARYIGDELPNDRLVFRWQNESSYSANVFYSYAYVQQNWGRILEVLKIEAADPPYQDVVILRKS